MKFIIQQFGEHWLIKGYPASEEGQAVAKDGNATRDVATTLDGAWNVVKSRSIEFGIEVDQLGEA